MTCLDCYNVVSCRRAVKKPCKDFLYYTSHYLIVSRYCDVSPGKLTYWKRHNLIYKFYDKVEKCNDVFYDKKRNIFVIKNYKRNKDNEKL